MRVLVYGMSSDKLGGIETFLLNMNAYMSGDMIFDYVIEGTDTIHKKAVEEKGGKVFFIAPKRQMIQNIKDWIRLLKEYGKQSDIVYFNMFSLAWSVPIYLCMRYHYKVIVHAHNNKLHDCGVVLKALHRINKELLKHMKIERFTNSSLSTDFFFGKRKVEMIYNAIDTNRFMFNERKRNEIRKSFKLDGKHVYGFTGRIMYQKNPLFLMDVFAEIKKQDDKAEFLVCGDGDLIEQTREKARKLGIKVMFLGNVQNIQDYYQAMDCYVLPSRFEGLGIVLIEAQCTGLPCVTSAEVVPKDTKVTDLLEFVPLTNNANEWAEICVRKCVSFVEDRFRYKEIIKNSFFEIRKEAVRLERIINHIQSD